MADETVGQKMSEYTPLDAGEKAYFMGEGNGSVVAVGKVASGGNDVNRLVKLSDIGNKTQIQADWSETDDSKPAFIKHKLQFKVDEDTFVTPLKIKAGDNVTISADEHGVITISASNS